MLDGPLDGTLFGKGQPCFGCSTDHPAGFHLTFQREGDEVVTRFTPGDRYQGPPGVMHGGLVMTLVDELAAWAPIALKEKFGFTSHFDGRLKAPVRIGQEIVGRARLTKDTTRVVKVGVTLTQNGILAFEGEVTFVLLDQSGAEKLLGGPLPEAWKRFSR
jgi:acyl-coenzyme A thioesterase PaaI-like protein